MTRIRHPQLHDADWLREQYVTQELSTARIAEIIGCSPSNVQTALYRAGVRLRSRYPLRWNPRSCERCGSEFAPSGPAAKFCSAACQFGTAECESCNKTFVKRRAQGAKSARDNRYCSYECRWAAAKARDDYGRYLDSNGYVILDKRYSNREPTRGLNDQGYVRLNLRKSGRVLEHRHVMEQKIGRPLLPDETVHHVNGVKIDNRPENLELWVSKHPRGQRVEDVVAWATEMLARYAPDRLHRHHPLA